ncbi:MAG TPA: alpha/beta hydrolase [Frankiaceae bacterium]|jgi:pimeloyl-ACP methyl ester carboxylesterase|nr:alpha/beta hydrolase [Frankiaceae bacterium]
MNLVLVHGSGFDSSCWDPLLPHLQTPAITVDLPGRRSRPADLSKVGLDDFAAAVAEDIAATDWERVVLVGHSLAGLTIPRVAGLIPERIARLVFVSSNVPAHGQDCLATLDTALAAGVRANIAANGGVSPILEREMSMGLYGNDLDDEQFEWMLAHSRPEAGRVLMDPCDLSGLAHPIPRTWIRLTRDQAGTMEMQNQFIANLGGADVIDLDAGHMAMISHPTALAAILDGLALSPA